MDGDYLSVEHAKELCRKAFEGGQLYERMCSKYFCNCVAYDFDHWIEDHADEFTGEVI